MKLKILEEMKMNDNNGLILLEVKCKSKGNNIITIDNIYCIISVSYRIEKNDLFWTEIIKKNSIV